MADNIPQGKARPMGFWMAIALVMGSMIGSGVFLLPVSLAPLGWNSVFGWIITIAGAMCVATLFARLATALPQAGGPYAYVREAFGETPGFAIAWTYWLSMWIGNAAIATGAVSYLSQPFPIIGQPGISALTSVAIIWFFTFINLRGTRLAGQVQIVWTIAKVLPLMAVIGLAFYAVGSNGVGSLHPLKSEDIHISAISSATILTLWAMLGLEMATVPADKVENPGKNIARATIIGTASAGAIYILVSSAIILMLPANVIANSPAPFADFVAQFVGADAGTAIAILGAVSAIGALNGWILAQGELPATLARDGLFPAWMGRTSTKNIPRNAHIFTSCLLTVVILLNSSRSMASMFQFLIELTTAIVLVMYLGCALAAARLISQKKMPLDRPFAIILPLAAIYSLWTIYGAGLEALGWGILLLVAAVPVHFLMEIYRPPSHPS